MRAIIVTHRCGDRVVSPAMLTDVVDAVDSCPFDPALGKSSQVRRAILDKLSRYGWSEELDVDPQSGITITSFKDGIGLCLQTGNMSRMYADLLKLQTVYQKGAIDAAIMIIPTAEAARELGSNIANQERLSRELAIFDRVITLPMVVVGFQRGVGHD